MKWFFALLSLLILAAGAAGVVVYRRATQPFKGYAAAEQFVDIEPGTSPRVIGEHLVAAGVVRDTFIFQAVLWQTGLARRLEAGEYRFDSPMTPGAVIDKLVRGDVYVRRLTFPEGLTIPEMAAIFEKHGFGPASAFIDAAHDPSAIADLDPEARDLEGYLFPETYLLPRRVTAGRLVTLMVARYKEMFTAELRQGAKARGLTIRQATTLASLVEKETARAEERPIVAAVYSNRIKRGMGLQCDPTVIYALVRAGRYQGNLTRADLAFDSPYNTYRYAGLPPGPIAAPGLASLQAVVRPAQVDFFYFVSRNDGSHEFARTLEEHNRNVRKYQILYFREKRLKNGP